jgi:hypothetical protein
LLHDDVVKSIGVIASGYMQFLGVLGKRPDNFYSFFSVIAKGLLDRLEAHFIHFPL